MAWSIFVAGLTVGSVFILPFAFPPAIPSRSTAYAAGASNRVAEIAIGLLSLLVAFVTLRSGRPTAATPRDQTISRRWLWTALAAMSFFLLVLGAAMVRANIFYGEAEYFLTQLDKGLKLHLVPYRSMQFAYGPVLYWWPILWIKSLHPFGVSTMPAYVGSLLTTQAAGIILLFYTVRALPLRRGMQVFAFTALVIGSLPPTLGPNYSIFRFVVPLAVAVCLSRRSDLATAAATAALGTAAGFAVSAEIGVGCLGAVLGCSIARAYASGARWLILIPAALAAAGLFVLITGPAYFQMIRDAGSGGYDLLLTPEPRTILLLIAIVGLAPIAVARSFRRKDASTVMLAAIYGSALGVMPVAVGRNDSVHEFFFSLGAILLSLVAIDQLPLRPPARLWIACVALWIVMAQMANYHLFHTTLTWLARQAIHPRPNTFDTAALERQLNGQPVFLIDNVSWVANEELLDKGLLAPSFFCEMSNVWREPAEERKIAEMRDANYALAYRDDIVQPVDFDSGPVARWKRLGLVYREKFKPFEPGLLTEQELNQNWTPVANISGEILYRKLR
jgi:hypothetical protein